VGGDDPVGVDRDGAVDDRGRPVDGLVARVATPGDGAAPDLERPEPAGVTEDRRPGERGRADGLGLEPRLPGDLAGLQVDGLERLLVVARVDGAVGDGDPRGRRVVVGPTAGVVRDRPPDLDPLHRGIDAGLVPGVAVAVSVARPAAVTGPDGRRAAGVQWSLACLARPLGVDDAARTDRAREAGSAREYVASTRRPPVSHVLWVCSPDRLSVAER
jgi:hypothetical protein